MKVKLLVFSKWGETSDKFEQRAREVVATLGEIVSVKSFDADGDQYFQFNYNDKPCAQDILFLAWMDTKAAEEILNNTLSHVGETGNTIKHVNLVIQSRRTCALLVLESNSHDDRINVQAEASKEVSNSEAEGQAGQQDQDADAEPDNGAEPVGKPKNRNASKRRVKGNG